MKKMKITEKIVLEKIGLKVGDIVYFNDEENFLFEIKEEKNGRTIFFESISNKYPIQLCDIINFGYDINVINMNGIWENARCKTHIDCKICPLRMLSCNSGQKHYKDEKTENKRLKDIYSTMKKYFKENCKIEDDEISNFIERRLKERIQDKTLREIVERSVDE